MQFPGIKFTYTLYFSSLLALFFCSGGLAVTLCEESVEPAGGQVMMLALPVLLASLLLVASVLRLVRGRWLPLAAPHGAAGNSVSVRHLIFSTVLFVLLISASLALLNLAASFFSVSWPMSGLHGVSSDVGKQAWEYRSGTGGFVKVNSWGQRDREHSLSPQPGSSRIVFIGDSLLEDGAAVPLPYRTEEFLRALGQGSYDVVNLGVSATDPDEYFFRLKRVGLPLQPKHCILMFSAGTDFIQEPSLLSYGGISSTYPRLSFLQILGLRSLDQVISNERRPILRAWFKGGAVLKHELELQEIFGKTVDDQETERAYLSFFTPDEQVQLRSVLYKSSAEARGRLYRMLRNPDNGTFRSYYLDIATKVAKGLKPQDSVSDEYSFRWVRAASELCRRKGVRFTLAVIPDGFSVDPRMRDQYAALADMKAYMRYKDEASDRLVQRAVAEGMQVADLRRILQDRPGSYLNMDGHWSQSGVDLVAGYLAETIMEPPAASAPAKR